MGFLDLRLITLADLDGTATRVIHEVAGVLDATTLDFDTIEYLTFLDLDGDTATGGSPSVLGFETAFEGAEIVLRVHLDPVIVEAAPAQLPVLLTHTSFWRFDLREQTFLEVQDAKVSARIVPIIDIIDPIAPEGKSFEELVGHSIDITFPNEIGGVISEQQRLQALSRGTRNGQVIVDRLDDSPQEAGIFRLVFPTFPVCEASPNSVEAGAMFHVNASGLLWQQDCCVKASTSPFPASSTNSRCISVTASARRPSPRS